MGVTVEELITRLQQIKDKKRQIMMDTPSSGTLLYKGIRDIRIDAHDNFVIITLLKD